MIKNVAIALNAGTPDQRNAITSYFSHKNLSFWHWIDDFWIVQLENNESLQSLHNELESIDNLEKPTILIFEFKGQINFYGRADKKAWEWLKRIGSVDSK